MVHQHILSCNNDNNNDNNNKDTYITWSALNLKAVKLSHAATELQQANKLFSKILFSSPNLLPLHVVSCHQFLKNA